MPKGPLYNILQLKWMAYEYKKGLFQKAFFGAQEGTRTPTRLTGPAPETGASTNSATWATAGILTEIALKVKKFFICPSDSG